MTTDAPSLIRPFWDCVVLSRGTRAYLSSLARLPKEVSNLLVAQMCEAEIVNGGFEQFFGNSTGIIAPEAAEAFTAIGRKSVARLIRRAMERLGPSYPRGRAARLRKLGALAEDEREAFEDLHQAFYRAILNWEVAADRYAARYARRVGAAVEQAEATAEAREAADHDLLEKFRTRWLKGSLSGCSVICHIEPPGSSYVDVSVGKSAYRRRRGCSHHVDVCSTLRFPRTALESRPAGLRRTIEREAKRVAAALQAGVEQRDQFCRSLRSHHAAWYEASGHRLSDAHFLAGNRAARRFEKSLVGAAMKGLSREGAGECIDEFWQFRRPRRRCELDEVLLKPCRRCHKTVDRKKGRYVPAQERTLAALGLLEFECLRCT